MKRLILIVSGFVTINILLALLVNPYLCWILLVVIVYMIKANNRELPGYRFLRKWQFRAYGRHIVSEIITRSSYNYSFGYSLLVKFNLSYLPERAFIKYGASKFMNDWLPKWITGQSDGSDVMSEEEIIDQQLSKEWEKMREELNI